MTLVDGRHASEHYYTLDVVRSVAAIAVLFWHYQNFFLFDDPGRVTPYQMAQSPLYMIFSPFFDHGGYAVQIFWMLSGFVFAAVYFSNDVSGRSFFWARFARLYPLHLLTLLSVLVLQTLSTAIVGHEQLFTNNDLYHFILQLLFVSYWGWENGHSFNGPIWSVSVEIMIYILFWFILPIIKKSKINFSIIISIYFWILAHIFLTSFYYIFECGSYFFAGAALYKWYKNTKVSAAIFGTIALIFLTSGVLLVMYKPEWRFLFAIPLIALGTIGIALAFHSSTPKKSMRPIQKVGDLTYGIYLWHIPLQISALILIKWLDVQWIVYSPIFLFAYIAIVLATAWMSYRFFELPMRVWLRKADR